MIFKFSSACSNKPKTGLWFQGLIQGKICSQKKYKPFGGLKRKLLLEAEVLLSGLLLLGPARLLLCTPASDEAAIAELSSVEHR